MSVIFHLPYSEKNINDLKFLGKTKAVDKVLLTMVPKVRALCNAYKLVVCMRHVTKQRGSQNFENRDNTYYKKLHVYKNLW